MKNLLLSFVLITFLAPLNVSFAHNEPVMDTDMFSIESINFEMDSKHLVDHAMEITFNEENGNLGITLNKEVSFLQIMNAEDVLEFQLPVFSKSVILDMDDFMKGDYKINILLDNESVIPASFTK